ncbi:MAG: hypothetical protein Phyf2KO_21360 [Phycisphaerales bacterium]
MGHDTTSGGAQATGTFASWLSLIGRLGIGQVLIFAGLMKIADPGEVAKSIIAFDVISRDNETLISLASHIIPWTELIAGVLLVMGLFTRAAATVAILLLAGFVMLILHALKLDQPVSCGCFGDIKLFCKAEITNCNLIQNGVLALLALFPLVIGGGRASADALNSPNADPSYEDYGKEEDEEMFD